MTFGLVHDQATDPRWCFFTAKTSAPFDNPEQSRVSAARALLAQAIESVVRDGSSFEIP